MLSASFYNINQFKIEKQDIIENFLSMLQLGVLYTIKHKTGCFFYFFYLFSFLLTINLKLITVHVEIKIVNKEAATKRSTWLPVAVPLNKAMWY